MQHKNHPSEHLPPASATQLIKAAISAAGRSPLVARNFGISVAAVNQWAARGYVPAERIKPLCALGNHAITPDQLLDAITRERTS